MTLLVSSTNVLGTQRETIGGSFSSFRPTPTSWWNALCQHPTL
jgi:hypothetical protein